jgi:endonuclease/exonuclease/phosphatase family metal-dependent hydrolase
MRSLPPRTTWLLVVVLTMAGGSAGCMGGHAIVPKPAVARDLVPPVAWYGPDGVRDTHVLSRWGRSVGPPMVAETGTGAACEVDRLVVVSWNVNVGAGDVARLLAGVRQRTGPDVPVVLLLQEAYRSGADVPAALDAGAAFPARIRGVRRDGRRDEIRTLAAALDLHAYYVPSMRNGSPLVSDEDRGNAILSTLPLDDLLAVELPFERQLRVAVAATVRGRTRGGEPWQLRVVSAHLDNLAGARRLWVAGSELARTRQARGLLGALDDDAPTILGADLNTLFGFTDRAYLETARAFPDTRVTDRRTTFRGLLRLDHLFFRLDAGWSATFHRAESSYGSDHYPLVGTVTFR